MLLETDPEDSPDSNSKRETLNLERETLNSKLETFYGTSKESAREVFAQK
jgi:hypothetical protein